MTGGQPVSVEVEEKELNDKYTTPLEESLISGTSDSQQQASVLEGAEAEADSSLSAVMLGMGPCIITKGMFNLDSNVTVPLCVTYTRKLDANPWA